MLKGLKTLERDRLKSVLPVSFTYYINLKKYKILPIVNKKLRTEHTRRLPHFHRVGATFFITTNLYGAIPKETLKQLQIKRDELIGRIPDKLIPIAIGSATNLNTILTFLSHPLNLT